MADKMLVTQALDERDLLVKKIQDKISKASFVDTIKPNEEKVLDARVSKDEFAKDAESAYQQIQDLIDRFQRIDAAIVASNANTTINTTYGSFTVAGAISLRSRLRGAGSYDGDADFERSLQLKMEKDYHILAPAYQGYSPTTPESSSSVSLCMSIAFTIGRRWR